jgi:hypothetical protein
MPGQPASQPASQPAPPMRQLSLSGSMAPHCSSTASASQCSSLRASCGGRGGEKGEPSQGVVSRCGTRPGATCPPACRCETARRRIQQVPARSGRRRAGSILRPAAWPASHPASGAGCGAAGGHLQRRAPGCVQQLRRHTGRRQRPDGAQLVGRHRPVQWRGASLQVQQPPAQQLRLRRRQGLRGGAGQARGAGQPGACTLAAA